MSKGSHRWNWKPAAGFRFSLVDALAITFCAAATWGMWPLLGEMVLLFPIVLAHFFLFCNVFRIPRSLELVWSAVFVINVVVWMIFDAFTWQNVLWTQLPVTLAVLLFGVFRGDYHGVGFLLVPWARKPEHFDEVNPHDTHLRNGRASDDRSTNP